MWAVVGLGARPVGPPDDVRIIRHGQAFTSGAGDVGFSSRPRFEPGETVSVGGVPATVLSDEDGDTVLCQASPRHPLRSGEGYVVTNPTVIHAARGNLVAENKIP